MLAINTGFVTGVGSLALSPCGAWLVAVPKWNQELGLTASAPSNFNIRYWRFPTPDARVRSINCRRPEGVYFLAPNYLLLNEHERGGLTYRPFPAGAPVRALLPQDDSRTSVDAISHDRRFILAARLDWRQRVWKRHLWNVSEELEIKLPQTAFSHEGCPTFRCAIHPTGNSLVSICSNARWDGNVPKCFLVKFAFPTGEVECATELQGVLPNRMAFSPDGRWFAGNCSDACEVRNASTLEVVTSLRPSLDVNEWNPKADWLVPTFTPDSRFLALGCFDGTVRLFDTITWTEASAYDWGKQLLGEDDRRHGLAAVTHVAFTPDGAMGIAAVGNNIVLWDME